MKAKGYAACLLLAGVVFARPAGAADPAFTLGVGVSAFQVASTKRVAVTPSFSGGLRLDSGVTVTLRDEVMVMPPLGGWDTSLSVQNRTTFGVGYSWPAVTIAAGVSFAEYFMSVCNPKKCSRLSGFSPGADVVVDWFWPVLAGALGVRVLGTVGWYGGSSVVLPGSGAVMVTAGPIVRFGYRGGL